MWKTFFISPLAGGIAAVLGWLAAVVFRDSMTTQEFADLRFGWAGALIGAIAIAVVVVLLFASDMVEPLVMTATAGFGAWLLWNQTDLPFSTTNLDRSSTPYWFAFSMMAGIFILLLMGLKAARETNHRARG